MSIWEEISHKARNAGNQVSGKTRSVVDKTKVKNDISELNGKRNSILLDIGKTYLEFRDGKEELQEKLDQQVNEIHDLDQQIAEKEKEIQKIDNQIVCPNCGTYLAEGTEICPSCGYDFVKGQMPESEKESEPEISDNVRRCPECGAILQDDALFCTNCGAKIETQDETKSQE